MRHHTFHTLYQNRLAAATKPFNARGAKVDRCKYCQIAAQYCICDHQPNIESNFAVALLVADAEILKPSNTGKLILDTIKQGFCFAWQRTEVSSDLLALIHNPNYQPIIVFPDEYVDDKQRLIKAHPSSLLPNKTPLFIFLDGSWREARRMFRKSAYLNSLPVCSIKPDFVSNYIMRKSGNKDHLATAEVASLLFEQFGAKTEADVLSHWFAAFRESYLLSKTRFASDKTRPQLNVYDAFIKSLQQ